MRRATALERLCAALLNEDPKAVRGLQQASQIPEALIDTQSPILIGLISMLIDSADREEISKALRRLWQRGFDLLNPQLGRKLLKNLSSKPMEKLTVEATSRG